MMQCQLCGDTNGPFQIEQIDGPFRIPVAEDEEELLICEDCWEKIKKGMKIHDSTNICNKRHAR